jgi:ATP:ADP antiporter, AAA family
MDGPDQTPAASGNAPDHPALRALRRLVLLRPGEAGPMLLSAGYFFFLLFGYYILKPIRDEMGVAGGVDSLTWLFTATMLVMLAVNPLFAALVSRLPRRQFIPITYHFFVLNLLAFFGVLTFSPDEWRVSLGRVFYIWASVFNLFAVSVFWGFMADVFRSEQGKRLFGFIGAGGTLGGLCGAAVTAWLVDFTGPVNLLLLSANSLEIAALCAVLIGRAASGRSKGDRPAPDPSRTQQPGQAVGPSGPATPPAAGPSRSALAGLSLLIRSPHLLGICLYILLFSLTQTFLYFEQARVVKATFTDAASRTAAFATIDMLVNALTLVMQLFLTGRIIALLGVGLTMTLVPLLTMAGFAWLGLAPTFAVLATFQVARRSLHYAVDRPSRELLYTVMSPDEKYKSKSFIDTFVYRGGDALGAWVQVPLVKAGMLAAAAVTLSVAWIATGILLGAWFVRRQARPSP